MAGKISGSTERALERIKQGQSAYSAAKDEGIALSTIYRALGRIKDKDKQTTSTTKSR